MTHMKPFTAGIVATIGLAISTTDAKAQYVPGITFGGPPIVVGGTGITPAGGIASVTQTYDPFWGTQSIYRGYANPYTGATYEQQAVAGPFGAYQTYRTYDPYLYPYPIYSPYGFTFRPAFFGQPQMAAYYNGVYGNRWRR